MNSGYAIYDPVKIKYLKIDEFHVSSWVNDPGKATQFKTYKEAVENAFEEDKIIKLG